MSTRTWTNANAASYTDPTQWVGGIAPTNGDTAVVATSGGPAPASGSLNNSSLYSPVNGKESQVVFTTGTLAPNAYPSVVSVQNGVTITSTGLYPAEAQIPVGDDIVGQTIDMLGQGSATAAYFQRTTIDPTTAINISGVALLENFYDNTLGGTINIGLPISVNGTTVATPATDSHGVANELDLELFGAGSVNEANDTLQSYVPTTDNTGTINIAANSELRIAFYDGPLFGEKVSATSQLSEFLGRAQLENDGTINVAAGGTFFVGSDDELAWAGTGLTGDSTNSAVYDDQGVLFWDGLDNTGQINIAGAAGQTTSVELKSLVTGTGTIVVNGGNQTDPSKTELFFNGAVVDDQTIVDSNAVVAFYDTEGDNFSRAVGGSFIFGDAKGVLLISPDTLQNGAGNGPPAGGYTVASGTVTSAALDEPFGLPIYGFRTGDTIGVTDYSSEPNRSYKLLWTQATDTLQVEEISSIGTVITAQFTLVGTYTQSEFTVTSTVTTGDQVVGLVGETSLPLDLVTIGLTTLTAGTGPAAAPTTSGGSGSSTTSSGGSGSSATTTSGSGSTRASSGSGASPTSGGSGTTTTSGGSGTTSTVSSGSGSSTASGATTSSTVSGGTPTVDAGSAGAFTVPAGVSEFVTSEANNTIVATSGAPTISASAGNPVVIGGSASINFIGGSGAATVIGGTGNNTVQGGSGSLLLFAVSPTTYTPGSGSSTIIGGTGGLSATIGSGGGDAFGGTGGGNTLAIAVGAGNSALVGTGSGDVLTDAGNGTDLLVAGAGAETLNAASSTGSLNAFFGGSGADSMTGGSGQSFFLTGSGNETLTGGKGLSEFVFLSGSTARTDTITNFNSGDLIGLFNYGSNAAAKAVASATVTSSGTTLTLSDNTTIVLAGFTNLTQANVLSA
jgi:Ca2+-binding RTX toxin-like protein